MPHSSTESHSLPFTTILLSCKAHKIKQGGGNYTLGNPPSANRLSLVHLASHCPYSSPSRVLVAVLKLSEYSIFKGKMC